MQFLVCVSLQTDGTWLATHESREVGSLRTRAASREEAIEKLRGEIRYRLELCPCSGATWQHVPIRVVEEPLRPGS